jgi:DNA-binding MarR family transcriptional regulator
MDRTTLGRNIRPLERDNLLEIGGAKDGRKRSLRITPAGEARLKTARSKWHEAQGEFEAAFGHQNAADLRSVLQRVIAVTGAGGD